jgi:hypothetical protein
MPPEDQARQEIDAQLAAAGWEVQDHRSMNLVRSFSKLGGRIDNLYYCIAMRRTAIG